MNPMTKDVSKNKKAPAEKKKSKKAGASSGMRTKSPSGDVLTRAHPGEFAKVVAREVVRSLSTIGNIGRIRPFTREGTHEAFKDLVPPEGTQLILVDSSVLVDGRILPIVNSGFLTGTLLIPEFVLGEVQHIADSNDSLRRAKGRRGLEVVNKLKAQKANDLLHTKIIKDDTDTVKEIDHKLASLARAWSAKLMTVDFNLAQYARAQGVKVLNINDLTQALKLSIIPGEEITIKITHEGKEKDQGVGYLEDGTMVVVDGARTRVGEDVLVIVSRVHQTPAGQLFFAKVKQHG